MGAINRLRAIKATATLAVDSIASRIFFDFAGDDVVIVLGSGRSGTSWLANICNYRNSFRYLFEPLNPVHISADEMVSSWCPKHSEAVPFLDRVINGRVRGKWVDSRNNRLFARRRLVKEIRANLMLPWISANYPSARVVLLLRNPMAVAASRKMLSGSKSSNWIWEPSLETLLREPRVRAQLSSEELSALSEQIGAGAAMEAIADWCINNIVTSRESSFNNVHVVYYEDLVAKNDNVVKSLLQFIGVEFHQSVDKALTKTSETSRREASPVETNKASVLHDWEEKLSSEELVKAVDLLELFGVSRFYTKDWQPVTVGPKC